jgi:polyhydroxyalkanoate synthesis regulator phasin
MKRWMKFSVAIAAVVVLMASGAFALVASAQTPTPPAGQTPGDVFWTTLAAKLNVSQDALKSAVRDAAKAVVAESVKAGKLTQQQADKLDERIDKLPLDKPPFPALAQRLAALQKARSATLGIMLDSAANTLAMSRGDLLAELRDGMTLGEIAQQKGIAPDKLKAAMLSVPMARIGEAVKNGKMTQDEANKLKARLEQQVDLNKRIPIPGQLPKLPNPPKP